MLTKTAYFNGFLTKNKNREYRRFVVIRLIGIHSFATTPNKNCPEKFAITI